MFSYVAQMFVGFVITCITQAPLGTFVGVGIVDAIASAASGQLFAPTEAFKFFLRMVVLFTACGAGWIPTFLHLLKWSSKKSMFNLNSLFLGGVSPLRRNYYVMIILQVFCVMVIGVVYEWIYFVLVFPGLPASILSKEKLILDIITFIEEDSLRYLFMDLHYYWNWVIYRICLSVIRIDPWFGWFPRRLLGCAYCYYDPICVWRYCCSC